MTQAEMKLRLFRKIDRLSTNKLKVVYQTLMKLLGEEGKSSTESVPSFVEPGIFAPGEKPGDFAGVWKRPERDLDALRKVAWGRSWYDEAEEET